MDQLLPSLLSFPPDKQVSTQEYDKQALSYVRNIQDLPHSTWRPRSDQKSLLELLDPAVNSIPYLFALTDTLRTYGQSRQELEKFLPTLYNFFGVFDEIQLRYVGSAWSELILLSANALSALVDADVSPLGDALLRLDGSVATFTTNYLLYVRLCIQLGQPSNALRIVDRDIVAFSVASQISKQDTVLAGEHESSTTYINTRTGLTGKISPEMVLEYNLLAATAYVSVRNWPRARIYLEYVILHPSPGGATSIFQVEAYKKWLLVGLLSQGRAYPTPRTAGQLVMKNITAVARPYDTLAETFDRREWKKYQADVHVGSNIWTEDGNAQLVAETASTLLRYCILDLQKTFAALPVSTVAQHLKLPADQTLILLSHLVDQKQLEAQIDSTTSPADPTLRFGIAPDDTRVTDTAIEGQTQRIEELVRFVKAADRRLQLTTEYIDTLKRTKRAPADGDPADQMDLDYTNASAMPFTTPEDEADEDIMA